MLAACAHAETVTFPARHDHRKGHCAGTITITAEGLDYTEGPRAKPRKKPHRYAWTWADVQQATLSAKELVVLTYEDRWLKLGADRELRFALPTGTELAPAQNALRTGLSRKFVAALADTTSPPLWTLPAKHLSGFRGATGSLEMRDGGLRFQARQWSRTWTWDDLENISSAGPYELTLTTFERSRIHYGGRRDFTFQLRAPITPAQVDQLWRRVTRPTHILNEFTNKEN